MIRCVYILLCHCLVVAALAADTTGMVCSVVKMQLERMPDMHIPRSGHQAMYVGDQLVVMGGHTDGFVPTPTAEYMTGNTWRTVNMVYSHDFGFAVRLSSGRVMIAGGAERELGIGQTFTIEYYDPETHSFQGYGCLDKKRAYAGGTEIAGGKVVVAGNWYNTDYIECFDSKLESDSVKSVAVPRAVPYVLQVGSDEAIIFGAMDPRGGMHASSTVDCYGGEAFDEPLLGRWNTILGLQTTMASDFFIGDKGRNRFEYLIPAYDADGQMAIIRIRGKHFELLDTACPIPMRSPWSAIHYCRMTVDPGAQRAYLVGQGDDTRFYVAAVDYSTNGRRAASVTLYYSDPVNRQWPGWVLALSPEGDLVISGGTAGTNYTPIATVVRLCVAKQRGQASNWWPVVWGILVALGGLLAVVLWGGKARHIDGFDPAGALNEESMPELMRRIELLMQQQVYLNPDLKLSDVADMLKVSNVKLSQCVLEQQDCTFSQFVNRYRVDYAKRLIAEQTDIKQSVVCLLAGFNNETSFYRAFKAVTGLTPKQWLAIQSS